MNDKKEIPLPLGEITLSPGEVWIPQEYADEETKTEEKPKHCFHIWQDVELFRSTVTECSKCGKLKDES